MKKLLVCVCSVLLLVSGCTKKPASSAPVSSAEVTTEKNLSDEYTGLEKDNAFYYLDKENVQTFIEHGTGVLFLGFPECQWCQAYVPQLNEVLQENDMKAAYYNIYTDKKEDRDFYDKIASLLKDQNGKEFFSYDNDGKQVIYMPLVLFIENGKIVAYDNETSTEDASVITPDKYWTDAKMADLHDRLSSYAAENKAAQAENDSKGCDSGCKVG